jgi:signal transduction histidine kinase
MLSQLRADFTSMVAHELSQPITAIRLSSDVLATESLTKGQAMIVESIQRETRAISDLVADVHAIASIERDRFAVFPVSVEAGALLEAAASFAQTLPGNHPFTCIPAEPGRVWADRARIGQVLRNLLSNAAKYSPPGAPIELRATRPDHQIRIEVIDHGPGVAPEERERIFDKFVRGREEETRGTKGAGLGLYLSRRIVEAHGGSLNVEADAGGGSVFWFELEISE